LVAAARWLSFSRQLWQRIPNTEEVNRQDAEDAKWPEPDPGLDECARVVVDAAWEVHRILGPGFLESVYQEALGVELSLRGVPFRPQAPIALGYKGIAVGQGRLDLLVADRLVVELKAAESLLPIPLAQILSYLKATDLSLGLLINFNLRFLRQGIRRVIRTP
jgi:GxxExxY protein